jgi:8-oxo-dGTP diphosphatase
MESPEIFQVAAGVIVQDGKYLITRRYDDSHQGGLWEFPGGKREEGETLVECLRREIKEELDLEVEVGQLLRKVCYAYALCTVELHFFRCAIGAGVPKAMGCQDFEWVRPDQLTQYSFPSANQPVLVDLMMGIDREK